MNPDEKKYLVGLRAALEAKQYPDDAVRLIMGSDFAVWVVGDAWKLHVPYETAQQWFETRWLSGPNKCYWLWQPGTELAKIPQDVASRAAETMKRRKPSQ
jgi:hypothetical protein